MYDYDADKYQRAVKYLFHYSLVVIVPAPREMKNSSCRSPPSCFLRCGEDGARINDRHAALVFFLVVETWKS